MGIGHADFENQSVMAMANTSSEKASIRAVSVVMGRRIVVTNGDGEKRTKYFDIRRSFANE